MDKTLYFNVEDDVSKIVARLKKEPGKSLVLVLPQKSYLFADAINLKLLKKQTDLLGKNITILTLDERGQAFAREADIPLKAMARGSRRGGGMGDINIQKKNDDLGNINENTFVEKAVEEPKKKTTKKKVKDSEKLSVKKHETVFTPEARDTLAVSSSPMFDKPPRKQKQGRRAGLVVAVIVLLVAVAFGWFWLPKGVVAITPKSETVSRTVALTLLTDTDSGDTNRLLIPAQKQFKQLEVSDKFDVTGKDELGARARGSVKIVNLSGSTLNLRSSTTTLKSKSGQEYKFLSDQTQIKGLTAAQVATNPDAGHQAEVEAVLSGDGGNLKKGEVLEITNQVFGNRPSELYARVSEEITGGNSRFVSVITQSDYDEAQKKLVDQAIAQVRTSLEVAGQQVAENGWQVNVTEFVAEKPLGTQTPTFVARVKVDINLLAFNEAGLRSVLRDRLEQTVSPNLKLQDSGLDTVTYKISTWDQAAVRVDASAEYTSKATGKVDSAAIGAQIKGKHPVEVKEIVLRDSNVAKVEVKLSPAWAIRMPIFTSRIEVTER